MRFTENLFDRMLPIRVVELQQGVDEHDRLAERSHSHRGFSPVINDWPLIPEPFLTVFRRASRTKTVETVLSLCPNL